MRKLYLLASCLVVFGLVLGSFGCAAPKPALTTPAEVSFEGKTIAIIVPSAPGGGTDVVARVYVKYLPSYLPGKPTMMVRNIPGGDGLIGVNYAYSARPDGLTVLASSAGRLIAQLLGVKAVHYDFLKMPTLVGTSAGALLYLRSGIIAKAEDLPKAKGLIFGTSSATSAGAITFIGAKELLNIPVERVILAYSGSGDARRAFLTGEINFSYDSSSEYMKTMRLYVEKGEVMPLFQTGLLDEKGDIVRDPVFPPIPTFKELYEKLYGKSPSGVAWEAFKGAVAAGLTYNRLLHLPSRTPDSIARAYWEACEKMIKDPEFRKVVDPLVGAGAPWKAGEAYDKEFKLNFGMKPEVREWLRDTLPKYGAVID